MQDAGFRVQGAGFRVQGSGCRVQDLGVGNYLGGARPRGRGGKVQKREVRQDARGPLFDNLFGVSFGRSFFWWNPVENPGLKAGFKPRKPDETRLLP